MRQRQMDQLSKDQRQMLNMEYEPLRLKCI